MLRKFGCIQALNIEGYMPGKETCDFWIGIFENSDDYFDFFGEDPMFFKDDADFDEKYISKFAKSQGENWIDHDLMESGYEIGEGDFVGKFEKYSYSDQWMTTVLKKTEETDIKGINTIVFITKGRIKKPTSVFEQKFSLQYIGEIEYNI